MTTKFNLTIYTIVSLFYLGCQYEDGPNMSLRSKKARAVNTWYIDKVYEEGIDKTNDYKNAYVNYTLEIKDDDNYNLSYRPFNIGNYSENGTWKFSDDKSKILFTPVNTTQANEFKILRLKNNEAWVSGIVNNKQVEIHYKD